ncbi:hypothetical protein KR044_012859 [Drosophila immigrans]|nr:hypothetical protein KR044_012859 [Drosophila immigrans]
MSEELSDATANEMEIEKEDEEDSFWDAFDNDSLLTSEKADEGEATNESQSSDLSQPVDTLSLVQERVAHMKKHFRYITDSLKQMLEEQQINELKTREIADKYNAVKYSKSGSDIASPRSSDQSDRSEQPELQSDQSYPIDLSEEPELHLIVERIGDAVACQTFENDFCYESD